ncbi:MAG: hypothetical protein GOU98_02675 [Candidatus Altiarchaeota archaeon]|nr:hypothetical protein [Candidatus Altiarchaeota archaeon]
MYEITMPDKIRELIRDNSAGQMSLLEFSRNFKKIKAKQPCLIDSMVGRYSNLLNPKLPLVSQHEGLVDDNETYQLINYLETLKHISAPIFFFVSPDVYEVDTPFGTLPNVSETSQMFKYLVSDNELLSRTYFVFHIKHLYSEVSK